MADKVKIDDNLYRRGNVIHYGQGISDPKKRRLLSENPPPHLPWKVTKTRLEMSLETSDIRKAKKLRQLIRDWRDEVYAAAELAELDKLRERPSRYLELLTEAKGAKGAKLGRGLTLADSVYTDLVADLRDVDPDGELPIAEALAKAGIDPEQWHALREALHGEPRPVEYRYSIKQALDDCEAERSKTGLKTHQIRSAALDYLARLGLEDQPLEAITRKNARDWLSDMLASGQAQQTVKHKRNHLGYLLDWAVEHEKIDPLVNPFRGLKIEGGPKNKRAQKVAMPDKVAEAVLTQIHPDDKLCFLVCLYTGARIDEAASLRPQDVREEGGILVMELAHPDATPGKNENARRVIPVHSQIRDRVLAWSKGNEPMVLPRGKRGVGRATDVITLRLGQLIAKLRGGDERITLHTTRHRVNTELLRAFPNAEADIKWVMGRIDKKKDMTGGLYYAGPTIERKAQMIESLPVVRELDEA